MNVPFVFSRYYLLVLVHVSIRIYGKRNEQKIAVSLVRVYSPRASSLPLFIVIILV